LVRDFVILGSGVCIEYKDELFILTAAHLIEGCGPADIDLLARPEAPLTRKPDRLVSSERFHPAIAGITLSPGAQDGPDDLALLHLSGRPPEMAHVAFYPATVEQPVKPIRKQVGIFGFPFESTRVLRRAPELGRGAFPYWDSPPVARVSRATVRSLMRARPPYRSSVHVLLRFPDLPFTGDNRNQLHDPQGLSGGAAWGLGRREPNKPWTPVAKPVAIIIAYARRHDVLVATRIKRAWALLKTWEEGAVRSAGSG